MGNIGLLGCGRLSNPIPILVDDPSQRIIHNSLPCNSSEDLVQGRADGLVNDLTFNQFGRALVERCVKDVAFEKIPTQEVGLEILITFTEKIAPQ